MYRRTQLAVAACAVALTVSAAAQAADTGTGERDQRPHAGAELTLVDRPAMRFERSIESHTLLTRYRELLERAQGLDVAPREDLLDEQEASPEELRKGTAELERDVQRASAEPEFGSVAGVSQATLDAIAACESGGDPTAVNPAGYYGKYQFDLGTWTSVGGSGNPAEASEAEQDHRAALLYSRAGSSPWPICG